LLCGAVPGEIRGACVALTYLASELGLERWHVRCDRLRAQAELTTAVWAAAHTAAVLLPLEHRGA
jgi:hypothetical protein